jgi:hypothetical protein
MKKLTALLAAAAAAIGFGPGKSAPVSDIPIRPGKHKLRPLFRGRATGRFRGYRAQGPLAKQRRLNFIYDSIRQANVIAKQRRADYLKRRTARWRALVENNFPRMLNEELARHGLA